VGLEESANFSAIERSSLPVLSLKIASCTAADCCGGGGGGGGGATAAEVAAACC
jgi:hypothetical protein